MPRLKPFANGMQRGLNHSNGLAANSPLLVRRSTKLSLVPPIETLAAPFIHPEVTAHGCSFEIVWSGRGPLTQWPERDWFVLLRDASWQPVWDRQPITASWLWARWMTGCDGRADPTDYVASFTKSSTPELMDVDQHERFKQQWARLRKTWALPQAGGAVVKRWRLGQRISVGPL